MRSFSTLAAISLSVRFAILLVIPFCPGFRGDVNGGAQAAFPSVTLAWDPNPEPDVTGYRLHYGTERGVYAEVLDVGNTTTGILTFPAAGTYFVVATAYNSAGLESLPSAEIVVAAVAPDSEPPVFVTVPKDVVTLPDSPGGSSALVTWAEPTVTDNVGVVSLSSSHASGDSFVAGTTTVTYTAVDAAGNLTNESFTVTVGGVEVWRSQTFGSSASDPLVAGDDANVDGDRWANLGEYALGFDVERNDGEEAMTQEFVNGQHVLRFHHNPYLADVILRVDSCGNFGSAWSTLATLSPGSDWLYDAETVDVSSHREGDLQEVTIISPADVKAAVYYRLIVARP
jgi:hypothetical protein